MHKKMTKAVTGSIMAAAMLASTAAVVPASAFAEDMCIGQSNFDDGVGLPWHICVTNPAEQAFDIKGGTYNCTIKNPGGAAAGGESRWDCQFRHRSLHIEQGHKYKVSFDVNASNDGEMATHIATLDGETAVVWLSNHPGTEAWNYGGQSCGSCPNGHSNNSSNIIVKKGDNHFESTFTANTTIEVAEWAFHYGGAGEWQNNDCFPKGTVLKFDNMVLECENCGNKFVSKEKTPCLWDPTNEMGVITPRSDVRINQIGYWSNLTKKASYATDKEIPEVTFHVVDASGNKVYTGKGEKYSAGTDSAKGSNYDASAGEYVQILDFTDIPNDKIGKGMHIEVEDTSNTFTNEKTGETYQMYISHDFDIVDPSTDNIYDTVLKDALNYYYQNRSGIDIKSDYITSGDKKALAHEGGHAPKDEAYVQSEWKKSYAGEFDGDKTYSVDGFGGWYDAGDHGKYVVNGGISVWTLQNMYEMSKYREKDDKWTNGAMVIPESGDNNPDILDETRYELEWMFKMIVDSKDPYWGSKYAGFVYHKLQDHKWTGLATRPYDYQDEWGTTRIIKPPTYAATLNMVACAAQAARLWKGYDDAFAKECLDHAKTSYAAVKKEGKYKGVGDWKKNPMFAALDQAIGGGAYGDNYVEDDMYWAACELYITTGDTEYYDDLKSYSNPSDTTGDDKAFSITSNITGGENNGSFSSLNWGCTAGLGTLSLYLNKDKISASEGASIDASIKKIADKYIDREEVEGMGIPYVGTTFSDPINIGYEADGVTPKKIYGYEWGSNSFVINNAIVMAYAYLATGENKYISGVSTALDYIFGRNGLGLSFVTGEGTYPTSSPPHRYWAYELDNTFPMAPDGVMSGGCGSGLQDPYVGGLGYERGEVPPQKCYVDSIEAWSVNEVTINWNAPFAWVISFLNDEIVDAPDPNDPPKQTTTGGGEDIKVSLWGDADCNGVVEINDAVLVMSYVSNKDANPITPQGLVNADVNANGDGISSMDALAIQRYLANIISELPESYL